MTRVHSRLLVFAALMAGAAVARAAEVRVAPDPVWWETGRGLQRAHCDFLFTHEGPDTLELTHVEVEALDAGGALLSRRFIGSNGVAPSIRTIPERIVSAERPLTVFNPFAEWEAGLPIARLRFRFELESDTRAETLVTVVTPRTFVQGVDLILPVRGRVFVFDAHDGLAHHRRFDPAFVPIRPMNLSHNSGRYAYDLSLVDSTGSMWRTDGRRREDWWSWNQPVRAVGNGRVAATCDTAKDYEIGDDGLSIGEIFANPFSLFGNYVVIDHGGGAFSLIAHLREGSVAVKPGDVVKQGQPVGRCGFSGSVFTVHTHYELRTGVGLDVDGLPSHFRGVERRVGHRRVPLPDGYVTTGDVLESR